MLIAIPLFPRFTALDAIGPYEVLSRVPGARVRFYAGTREPIVTDRGLSIVPDATFDDSTKVDVLVVPGGPGQFEAMEEPVLMSFVTRAASEARIVASVCTGSLILARAGLLAGRKATTHWLARDALASLGAHVVDERIVEDGVITAAGVSAGIDLALMLAARLSDEMTARAIQLGIEYDPQPPFDAGSPEKAPDVAAVLRANARAFM